LTQAGHDEIHTLDLPEGNRTTDKEVARHANADGRTLVSKDADFVNSFQLQSRPRKLLLVSTGNITNDGLVTLWEEHLHAIVRATESSSFVELTANAVVSHS
jgi:predicted nuclease of predicted toxin-antitoxin system